MKNKKKQYKNPDNDPRGDWAESDYRSKWTKDERHGLYYAITNPNTGEKIFPDTFASTDRVWSCSYETHLENEKNKLVWWGKDGKSKEPKKKRFLSEHNGANTRSIWLDAGSNDEASKEIALLFPENKKIFDTPKPTKLLKKIVAIICDNNHDDLILDFFAGSGTTGDAVMQLNAEDRANSKEGNRKYILVQLSEPIDPKKNKTAYDFVKNEIGIAEPTICEITKERLVRAGKQI